MAVRLALLLTLLVALAPAAHAQLPTGPAPPVVSVELSPVQGTLAPFQGSVTSVVTTKVSCALAAQSPQTGLAVSYTLATKPPGILGLVLPPQDVADAKACDQGFVVLHAQLSMTASAAVAAFQDAEGTVTATVSPPSGAQSGSATIKAPVGYYGGLQLSAPEKVKQVRPGEAGDFLVTVKNVGNAASTITFAATATEGLTVEAVPTVTIDPAATSEVHVRFQAVAAEGLVNRGDPITLKASPVAQKDASLTGPVAQLGLRVNTVQATQEPSEKEKKTPAAPLAPALALAAVALITARRRP